MKAAVYVRVSTEEQVDGYSLDAQVRAAKAYCEKEKWHATFFEEPGASGTSTEKRPVFRDMIARCKAHQFDVVLVHKMDRFARSREDSIVYKSLLKREGIRVISVTEQFDDGPMGQLVEGFMECIAQWYSANLSMEVKKGLAERVLAGKHHAKVPIGYLKNADGLAIIDPVTGPIIKQAFQRYATGQETLHAMHHLVALGTGSKITFSGVYGVLRNPFYTGKIQHKEELLAGVHEALIDDELFNRVTEVMKQNARGGAGPRALRVYEISGLLRCSCGASMAGHSSQHGKYSYYFHVVPRGGSLHKNAEFIQAAPAEQIVNHLLCRPVRKDWQYRIASSMAPAVVAPSEDRSVEKLARAKELYIGGDMTKDEYNSLKRSLDVKVTRPAQAPDIAALLKVISVPEAAWVNAQPAERKERNRLLLKSVKIKDYEIVEYELTDLGKAVFGE